MSRQSGDPFFDALDAIEDVDVAAEEESEEKDTPAEDPKAVEREAPAEDNQDRDPDTDDDESGEEATDDDGSETPDTVEDEPQDDDQGEDTEADDDEEGEPQEEGEPEIEIAGKKYTRTQIEEELEKSGLRQDDYTRKAQELAEQRRQLAAEREAREGLLDEMVRHEGMQEFISEHPKAIKYLLKHPDATKKLLANSDELEAFIEDYESISRNPRLAERFSRNEQDPSVQADLQHERTVRAAEYIGVSVDNAIDHVLQEVPDAGVSKEEVENHLRNLVGMPREQTPENAQATIIGFQRLHSLMFVRDESGTEMVDPRVVRDFVNSRKEINEKRKTSQTRKAEDHNSKVDAALKSSKDKRPAVMDGAPPGTTEEEPVRFQSFEEAYQHIMS